MPNNRSINRYLNKFTTNEQRFLQSLYSEAIAIHGIEVYYMPRPDIGDLNVLNEADCSKFEFAYPIPAYVKSYDGFNGDDMLAKFGIEITDDLTLNIAKDVFEQIVPNHSTPEAGDIIWFPYTKQLFEVHFNEDEEFFYVLGETYTYELKCKLFVDSSEEIDTDIPELDSIQYGDSVALNLELSSSNTDGGTYFLSELVESGNVTATVFDWNAVTNILKVGLIEGGDFAVGANVIGVISGADYVLETYDPKENPNNDNATNDLIEETANSIINFDENMPFGNW